MFSKNIPKNRLFVAGGFVALALALTAPTLLINSANAAVTTNVMVPIQKVFFIPCANSGQGELVVFSGTLHVLFLTTLDSSGGALVKVHFQPMGVIATGQTTGDIWHATGVTQGITNTHVGAETSFVNNFRLIGPGSTVNFIVHEVMHITVNPDGTVTTSFDHFSASCG